MRRFLGKKRHKIKLEGKAKVRLFVHLEHSPVYNVIECDV